MRARILLIVCLLLMVGLSLAGWYVYGEYLSQKQVSLRLSVETFLPGDGLEFELRADGQPLPPLPPDKKIDLPSRKFRRFGPEALPELTGRVRLPCGWRDLSVKVTKAPTVEEYKKARASGAALELAASVSYPGGLPGFDLYVDNRGGAEARLAVGEMELMLPADTARDFSLPAPDCEAGSVVRLDAREVGHVPVELSNPNRKISTYSLGIVEDAAGEGVVSDLFLLDTTGQRCYRLSEKHYSPPGVTPFGGFWGGPAGPLYFRKKVLHHLPATTIDYFFEKAPDQITISYTSDYKPEFELRNELNEATCW